jgi:hypothetical protein
MSPPQRPIVTNGEIWTPASISVTPVRVDAKDAELSFTRGKPAKTVPGAREKAAA